jgi:AraC-like DNA-binding protein
MIVTIKQQILRAQSQGIQIRKRNPLTIDVYVGILELTQFLEPSAKIKQRIYCVLNDISSCPKCKHCNINNTQFLGPSTGYRDYCSVVCSSNSVDKTTRIENTNIQKYGFAHPAQNSSIQQKMKDSTKQKFGVEFSQQSQIVKNKTIESNIEKYGVKTFVLSDVFNKKRKITLHEKYNVDHINQRHIDPKNLLLLNDSKWLYNQNHEDNRLLIDLAQQLGVSISTICRKFIEFNIIPKYNNSASSLAEKQIQQILTNNNIEFQCNVRHIIAPKEIDIWIPKYNLAIEYCGLYWHSDIHPRIDRNYHLNQLNECNKLGIRLLTIFEDEWMHKRDIVISKILNQCNIQLQPPVFARKCEIIDLSIKQKTKFFNDTHIQGTGDGSITYGLIDKNNIIVAAMTFINRKNGFFELNRYSTSCKVAGGFSRLLKHFQRNNEWQSIMSYADLRWSVGNVYQTHGFALTNTSPPDYFYFTQTTRFHRRNFIRSNIHNVLANYDPQISMHENCLNHNFLRIWGCGQQCYTLVNN